MPIPRLSEKNACPNALIITLMSILLKSGFKKNSTPRIASGRVSDFTANITSSRNSTGISTFDNFSMPFCTPINSTTKLMPSVIKVHNMGVCHDVTSALILSPKYCDVFAAVS